ncbi:MAG: MazG-like family protein [Bacilli bacterium]|nr:MazG-like family protein [Bacilli bacterium]
MIDLKEKQKEVYNNKVEKGFSLDPNFNFNLLYGEVGEAFEAYYKKHDDLGSEFADIVIYVMGLCETLGIDLEDELIKKIDKNKNRKYKKENGAFIKVEE